MTTKNKWQNKETGFYTLTIGGPKMLETLAHRSESILRRLGFLLWPVKNHKYMTEKQKDTLIVGLTSQLVRDKYAQVILHPGCAIPPIGETKSRLHKWSECRSRNFFLRIARKHQHKLKSNGLAYGIWIKEEK